MIRRSGAVLSLAVVLLCTTNSDGFMLPVIDEGDIVQNTVTALQTTISALQNYLQVQNSNQEVTMMKINLMPGAQEPDDLQQFLRRLNEVLREEQALHYQINNISGAMRAKFPGYEAQGRWIPQYQMWTATALATLRGLTATTHEQLKESEQERERRVLERLNANSENAPGARAAIQAGNAITLQMAQEQRKMTQLIGAQLNAQTVALSNDINQHAAAEYRFNKWVEDAQFPAAAYTGAGGFGPNSFGR